MKRLHWVLFGVALAGALLLRYDWEPGGLSARVGSAKDRKSAPDFALTDATGSSVRLSSYKGKVVLLNFWATWCGPCKIEIPWFVDFEKTYNGRGFAVLGVSLDDDGWAAVRPYIEQKKVNYRVVVDDGATAKKFGGVEALPTTLLIDRDGKIAAEHVGLTSKSTYEDQIEQLLGK
jgi:cytochrome c biogenesis protein CcmG/thiol:disulfide interchange protein DsbE